MNLGNGPVIHNWQFCICRWPSFFIGYVLSSSIKQHKEGSILWFVVLPLCVYTAFFVLNHTLGTNFSLFWTQGIPVMTIAVIVIDKIHSACVNEILDWLGNISLESYATNIYLVSYLIAIPLLLGDISFHHYDFIAYVVGTLVCFFVSCLIHKVSSSIIKWLTR